jgi:putative ABC transport system substrate-binding protein
MRSSNEAAGVRTTPEVYEKYIVGPIQRGIKDAGFVEGSNVGFEYRWANDQAERLPRLATELVELRVAAIVTTGGNGPVRAAMAATSIVPIVFATGADPVQTGLVTKLSGSGTNVTSSR